METNPRIERLRRSQEIGKLDGCDYCGTLKNNCERARRGRTDRYKNHRRSGGRR